LAKLDRIQPSIRPSPPKFGYLLLAPFSIATEELVCGMDEILEVMPRSCLSNVTPASWGGVWEVRSRYRVFREVVKTGEENIRDSLS
jgi:hypothetical protein